jgi:Rrf2 family iron-sulfur cluster assembly transcriptional regulator
VRLTSKGRYAVMALADLASHSAGRPVALTEIAARQGISLSYLEQLFAGLRRAGLVRSVRGPGGGYRLGRPAGALWVADVVRAVEEAGRSARCTPAAPERCAGRGERCLTHELWAGLGRQMDLFLRAVSIADVCAHRVPTPVRVLQPDQPCPPIAAE